MAHRILFVGFDLSDDMMRSKRMAQRQRLCQPEDFVPACESGMSQYGSPSVDIIVNPALSK